MAKPASDILGQRFGKLVAIARAGSVNRNAAWECQCDCGITKTIQARHLKSGNTVSCGCYAIEVRTTHGMKNDGPLYWTWSAMIQRCTNPNHQAFKNYGARGIRVCERWRGRDGYVNFLSDMGERPDGMTMDRIDNDGNYEPGNCQWATWDHQAATRRPKSKNREYLA